MTDIKNDNNQDDIVEMDKDLEMGLNLKYTPPEEQLSFKDKDFEEPCYIEQHRGISAILVQLTMAKLSKTELRIYAVLWVENGNQKNIIFDINQAELAKEMSIKKPNISRLIARLIESGVLEKLENNQYRFTINKDLIDETKLC